MSHYLGGEEMRATITEYAKCLLYGLLFFVVWAICNLSFVLISMIATLFGVHDYVYPDYPGYSEYCKNLIFFFVLITILLIVCMGLLFVYGKSFELKSNIVLSLIIFIIPHTILITIIINMFNTWALAGINWYSSIIDDLTRIAAEEVLYYPPHKYSSSLRLNVLLTYFPYLFAYLGMVFNKYKKKLISQKSYSLRE